MGNGCNCSNFFLFNGREEEKEKERVQKYEGMLK